MSAVASSPYIYEFTPKRTKRRSASVTHDTPADTAVALRTPKTPASRAPRTPGQLRRSPCVEHAPVEEDMGAIVEEGSPCGEAVEMSTGAQANGGERTLDDVIMEENAGEVVATTEAAATSEAVETTEAVESTEAVDTTEAEDKAAPSDGKAKPLAVTFDDAVYDYGSELDSPHREKRPFAASTPATRTRHLRQTPKSSATPDMAGVKEMLATPRRRLKRPTGPFNETIDADLERFFSTPRAKDAMMAATPLSAIITKSCAADSVALAPQTECSLHAGAAPLEDLYKTSLATRLDVDLSESGATERAEKERLVENAPLERSAEEIFDEMVGMPSQLKTPADKCYARKSLSLQTQSPFSAAAVLSDLPKTDVQEWVDSLEATVNETANASGELEPPPSPIAAEEGGLSEHPSSFEREDDMSGIHPLEVTADGSFSVDTENEQVSAFEVEATICESPAVRPAVDAVEDAAATATVENDKENKAAQQPQVDVSRTDLSPLSTPRKDGKNIDRISADGPPFLAVEFQNFNADAVVLQQRSATPGLRKARAKISRKTLGAQEELELTLDLASEKRKLALKGAKIATEKAASAGGATDEQSTLVDASTPNDKTKLHEGAANQNEIKEKNANAVSKEVQQSSQKAASVAANEDCKKRATGSLSGTPATPLDKSEAAKQLLLRARKSVCAPGHSTQPTVVARMAYTPTPSSLRARAIAAAAKAPSQKLKNRASIPASLGAASGSKGKAEGDNEGRAKVLERAEDLKEEPMEGTNDVKASKESSNTVDEVKTIEVLQDTLPTSVEASLSEEILEEINDNLESMATAEDIKDKEIDKQMDTSKPEGSLSGENVAGEVQNAEKVEEIYEMTIENEAATVKTIERTTIEESDGKEMPNNVKGISDESSEETKTITNEKGSNDMPIKTDAVFHNPPTVVEEEPKGSPVMNEGSLIDLTMENEKASKSSPEESEDTQALPMDLPKVVEEVSPSSPMVNEKILNNSSTAAEEAFENSNTTAEQISMTTDLTEDLQTVAEETSKDSLTVAEEAANESPIIADGVSQDSPAKAEDSSKVSPTVTEENSTDAPAMSETPEDLLEITEEITETVKDSSIMAEESSKASRTVAEVNSKDGPIVETSNASPRLSDEVSIESPVRLENTSQISPTVAVEACKDSPKIAKLDSHDSSLVLEGESKDLPAVAEEISNGSPMAAEELSKESPAVTEEASKESPTIEETSEESPTVEKPLNSSIISITSDNIDSIVEGSTELSPVAPTGSENEDSVKEASAHISASRESLPDLKSAKSPEEQQQNLSQTSFEKEKLIAAPEDGSPKSIEVLANAISSEIVEDVQVVPMETLQNDEQSGEADKVEHSNSIIETMGEPAEVGAVAVDAIPHDDVSLPISQDVHDAKHVEKDMKESKGLEVDEVKPEESSRNGEESELKVVQTYNYEIKIEDTKVDHLVSPPKEVGVVGQSASSSVVKVEGKVKAKTEAPKDEDRKEHEENTTTTASKTRQKRQARKSVDHLEGPPEEKKARKTRRKGGKKDEENVEEDSPEKAVKDVAENAPSDANEASVAMEEETAVTKRPKLRRGVSQSKEDADLEAEGVKKRRGGLRHKKVDTQADEVVPPVEENKEATPLAEEETPTEMAVLEEKTETAVKTTTSAAGRKRGATEERQAEASAEVPTKRRVGRQRKAENQKEREEQVGHEATEAEEAPAAPKRRARKESVKQAEREEESTDEVPEETPGETIEKAPLDTLEDKAAKEEAPVEEAPVETKTAAKKTSPKKRAPPKKRAVGARAAVGGRRKKNAATEEAIVKEEDEPPTVPENDATEEVTETVPPPITTTEEPPNSAEDELTPAAATAAAPRHTLKPSAVPASDAEDHVEVKKRRPRRAVAAQEHNYDESSDTELARIELRRQEAAAAAAATAATTSRGRVRKPTARVEEFLERERAKSETPKKRLLLAAMEAAAATPPEPTAPVRRGRKASTTEVDSQLAVAAKPKRGRVLARKASETVDEARVEEEPLGEVAVATPAETTASAEDSEPPAVATKRRGGKSKAAPAKAASEVAVPPIDSTETSPPAATAAKKRAYVRRGTAPKKPVVVEEEKSSDDDEEVEEEEKKPAGRAGAKGAGRTKAVKAPKEAAKPPAKRNKRLASKADDEANSATAEADNDGDLEDEDAPLAQVLEKTAAKRSERRIGRPPKVIDETMAPAVGGSKRGRRLKSATEAEALPSSGAQLSEVEGAGPETAKTSRTAGRGRKMVRFEAVDGGAEDEEAPAVPAKRTRTRRN